MRATTRWCAAIVVASLLTSNAALSAEAAPTAPMLSQFSVGPSPWQPTAAPLTLQASFSAAGAYEATLTDVCTSTPVRSASGPASQGINVLTFDGLTPAELPDGVYLATVTPKSTDGVAGTASSAAITLASGSANPLKTICSNAQRLSLLANTDKGLAAAAVAAGQVNFPDAKRVVLIPASAKPWLVAVATVYAARNQVPLLFSATDKLTYSVKQDLIRREATHAYIVGPENSFAPKVLSTLKSVGLKTPLRLGSSPLNLAFEIYRKTNQGHAVYVDFKSSVKTVLQAVSFATATGWPLLDLSPRVVGSTKAVVKYLDLKGGIAIGTAKQIPDAVLKSDWLKKVSRVSAKDDRALAMTLARTATDPVGRIALRSSAAQVRSFDFLGFNQPALSLVLDSKGLSLDQRAWLNARGDVQKVVVTEPESALSDFAFARVAAAMLKRGEPTVIPVLEPLALGPASAPPTFAFSGSGWGHGIGLSQWGAYAMAKAGKSETEILQHYYTDTTVESAPDDADVFVGLCVDTDASCYRNANRVSSLTLRVKSIGGSQATMKLQAADGTSVVITPAHTVTFTFIKSSGLVKTTIVGTDAPTLKTSSLVVITWSGTRFSGSLGAEAAVAQVAGPGSDIAAGRTYRFGSMRVRASAPQTDLVGGLSLTNRVRLHDEYLYGIGEVSSSWPAAALRAQVVAARSYVYNDVYNSDGTTRPRRLACDCQVYGDIRDQNYVGWSKISSPKGDLWKAAVDATLTSETEGLVVKNGNTVVQTFFAAANGGATQNNEDVWGGSPRSYLRSVDDPWTLMPEEAVTVSAWSPRVRTQKVVAAAFGLSDVATLDLSDRFSSGALRSVTATSTSGAQATISGEKFRSSMVSDTGSSLMSTWVWRSLVAPSSAAAPGLSEEFIRHRFFGFSKAPGSTATKAVLVSGQSGGAMITAAAGYAAVTKSALIVVKATGDATRIKNLLAAQSIKYVVLVGQIDSAVTSALSAAKVSWRTIQGDSIGQTSRKLAVDAGVPADKGVVIASSSEPKAWPLAVSVAATTGRSLLFAESKTLGPDVLEWLSSSAPASVYVVGSTNEIPDVAVAGFADVTRITTSDLALASLSLLGRGSVVVRGVIVMSADSDPLRGVLAALSAMPIVYEDASTIPAVLTWLRRQSLAAAVVDLGVTPEFVQQIRRA